MKTSLVVVKFIVQFIMFFLLTVKSSSPALGESMFIKSEIAGTARTDVMSFSLTAFVA